MLNTKAASLISDRMRVVAASLALIAGPAAAADDPFEPPDLKRFVRWGPLRVRPGFQVSNLGYDDNVFFSSGNQTKRGDYRITVSPRLEGLVLFGHRAFLTFDEKIDYTLYRRFHDQNYLNQALTARATIPRKRVAFFTDLGIARLKDRPTSELDRRLERDENRLGAGIILKLGWRSFAELGHHRSDWSHADPDRLDPIGERLDRVERAKRLRLEYRIAGRTRLTLQAEATKITFDNPAIGRDSRERSLLPGIRFGEAGRLSGTVELGLTTIDLRDPGKRDFSGLVGEAKLAYRLGTGTTLRLDGRRDVGFSVFENNNFFLDRSLATRVIHYFNRIFGVEVGGWRGKLTFPRSDDDRVDRVAQLDLGLRLRLLENAAGRRVEYSLLWRRYRRDSNDDALDQNRSTIGLGAIVGF